MASGQQGRFARLAVSDSWWTAYDPTQTGARYLRLLASLTEPDRPGRGWLRCDGTPAGASAAGSEAAGEMAGGAGGAPPTPATQPADPDRAGSASTADLPQPDGTQGGSGAAWSDDAVVVRAHLERFVEPLDLSATSPPESAANHLALLSRCDARLFMDRRRCEHVIAQLAPDGAPAKDEVSVDYSVGITFEFAHVVGQFWVYPRIDVWTHWPQAATLAPPATHGSAVSAASWDAEQAAHILDGEFMPWVASPLSQGLREALGGALSTEVFGQEALPPTFYTAIPLATPYPPCEGYLTGPLRGPVSELLSRILLVQDLHSRDMAVSGLQPHTLGFYRVIEQHDRFVPNYVLLPTDGADLATVERETDHIAGRLQYLEHYNVRSLWDIATDLEVALSHLNDYARAADEGSEIVDALALRFMDPDERHLERVRHTIDLARRTVLQSEAEIAQRTREVELSPLRIRTTQQATRDHVARTLPGERIVTDRQPVIDRLLDSPLSQHVMRNVDTARIVASSVERLGRLLDTGSSVLEEIRERTLERLDRTSFAFNIVVAFLAALTAVDLLVDVRWTPPEADGWIVPVVRGVVLAGLAGGLLLFILFIARLRRVDTGVDAQHAPLQGRLVRFLRRIAGDDPATAAMSRDEWDAHDRDQARAFAALWADLNGLRARRHRATQASLRRWLGRHEHRRDRRESADDVDSLVARAQQWSLSTLLLTERPSPMWRFPLPRVACLYRFLTPSAISDFELTLSLQRHCGLSEREIDALLAWGSAVAQDLEPSEVADQLDRIGLALSMDDDRRAAMHQTITSRPAPF